MPFFLVEKPEVSGQVTDGIGGRQTTLSMTHVPKTNIVRVTCIQKMKEQSKTLWSTVINGLL